jgi:uncharacterized protein YigA (DUF484 family)
MTSPLDSNTVAQYLADHPAFFQEHAPLLAKIQLPSPVLGRAVSLQERQIEVMREKFRGMELRMSELVRIAQDNDALAAKYYSWACALLLARNDVDLPHALINGLQSIFSVPNVSLRLWRVADEFAHTWFAEDVGDDVKLFANSLSTPYCGVNRDFEAVRWLESTEAMQSITMLPLRNSDSPVAFGLLVMGSPEPDRFAATMATDFLVKIGETASAAVSCLLD